MERECVSTPRQEISLWIDGRVLFTNPRDSRRVLLCVIQSDKMNCTVVYVNNFRRVPALFRAAKASILIVQFILLISRLYCVFH